MARVKAYRRRPILDLLKANRQSSNYETSIPNQRPRYLDASASNPAPRQGTQIARQLEAGEIEWQEGEEGEEEYEDDNTPENMDDHFAEADSEFEVDPQSETTWRRLLSLRRDDGNNRKEMVPRTDSEFAHRYNELKTDICEWAFKYFSSPRDERYELAKLLDYPVLLSYIDSIAAATGPNLFWADILETMTPRLVMGIIMKFIQGHIFGMELFGSSVSQKKILRAADTLRTKSDKDSQLPSIFKRQKIRASIVNSFCPSPFELPIDLKPDVLKLATGLALLLEPLQTDLGGRASRYAHSLTYLLIDAAKLHFYMRREPDTIYYFYNAKPGDLIDHHTQYEVPLLPTYNKPERGDPKQRIHIALAPGIMALRRFTHPASQHFLTRCVADVMAVAEWVNRDQMNKASKLSQNLK